MIELLSGENTFELTRAVRARKEAFDGDSEQYEATDLTNERMADLMAGQTLFASKRLIIIDTPSANTSLWQKLPTWLERVGDETHVVLVETKPDKRTATYKWLKSNVKTEEFVAWTSRDAEKAEEWLRHEATRRGMKLTHNIARLLVRRVGLDQWQLHHALEKLRLLDDVNEQSVTAIIEARPDENVFELLTTALQGDQARLQQMLSALSQTEDAYRVFGLLSSQVIQLTALTLGKGKDVAGDLGSSPFMLNRLNPIASRLSADRAGQLLRIVAATDRRLKSSPADPWLLIEHMLMASSRV